MGRRANGEGTIFKLPDGRWCAMLDIGYDERGKRKRKKIVGATRGEVAAKLADLRKKQEQGLTVDKQQLFRIFIEAWMRDVVRTNRRPKTVAVYKQLLHGHILPALGDTPLDKVSPQLIQRFLSKLLSDGYAPATVALVRSIVRSALTQAVRWNLIGRNPTDGVTIPRPPTSGGRTLTPEQARTLLEAARGERLGVGIHLALSLGLRNGEVCGLRWSDVDLDTATLTVNSTLSYTAGYGIVRGEPKSRSGKRTLPLPAQIVAALRWHQSRQRAEHAAMNWPAPESVLSNVTSGGPLNAVVLRDAFRRCLRAAGLPETIRVHDLRHSCATFLLAQGVHIKTVSAILGHSDIQTTLGVYGHLLPGDLEHATDTVANLLDTPTSRKVGS